MVFPEPVFAAPRMSRPASACGIDARCTFVMDVNLALVRPSKVAPLIGSSENRWFLEKLASWPRSGASATIRALSASISLMSRWYSGTTGFFRPPLFLRPARPSTPAPPPPPPWPLLFLCDDGIVKNSSAQKQHRTFRVLRTQSQIHQGQHHFRYYLPSSLHTLFYLHLLVDVKQEVLFS